MDLRDDEQRCRDLQAFLVQARWEREHPWWRPGAMRPADRERLVRTGLELVLGGRAREALIFCDREDVVHVGEQGHLFGFPVDTVLGDDPRTVFEHDVDRLIDELCETSIAWGQRLPACPLHPGSHPLEVTFTDTTATATCPVTGAAVRSVVYATPER